MLENNGPPADGAEPPGARLSRLSAASLRINESLGRGYGAAGRPDYRLGQGEATFAGRTVPRRRNDWPKGKAPSDKAGAWQLLRLGAVRKTADYTATANLI